MVELSAPDRRLHNRKHAALTCCVEPAIDPGGSDGYHIVDTAPRARSKPERRRALVVQE